MVQNIPVSYDKTGNLLLQPLIENIKSKVFPIRNHMISYQHHEHKAFVLVAHDPVGPEITIPTAVLDH